MTPAAPIPVCLGFDGSSRSDHTGIRLETWDGYQFTPTYGPPGPDGKKRKTHWDPSQWGGRIPRGEVKVAMTEIYRGGLYVVERGYFDPRDWDTEIDEWALEFGDEHVTSWDTGRGTARVGVVFAMLERFFNDLTEGRIPHDDCEITAEHMANARKVAKPGERYILGKPNDHQKIDMAMTSALCHEAAADARAAGWQPPKPRKRMIVRR